MTSAELERIVVETLARIAPELDAPSIDRRGDLRDQLDLDSMDFLNFVIALHERLDVDIPEGDYPRLSTLEGAVGYLSTKLDLARPHTAPS